jgi:hypothetical protein
MIGEKEANFVVEVKMCVYTALTIKSFSGFCPKIGANFGGAGKGQCR